MTLEFGTPGQRQRLIAKRRLRESEPVQAKHEREELTERELLLLRMLADGATHQRIASAMQLATRNPVLLAQRSAMAKLEADTPTHAVAIALRRKLIK